MPSAPPLPPNPFTHRAMIRREEDFVGRSREASDLLNRLRTGNSVSVVGERRIGKSSLLYHLMQTGNRRLRDDNGEQFQFLYLDFLSAEMRTPAHFCSAMLSGLGINIDGNLLASDPLLVLEWHLRDQQKKQRPRPIVLLDEFEEITRHRELFNDPFLESLRSLCNAGLLTLATASRQSLQQLTEQGDLVSPFWNIFASRPLKAFRVDGRVDEVEEFLQRYWAPAGGLRPEERRFLDSFETRHPLALQVISYWLWENRQGLYEEEELREEALEELRHYFREGEEGWKGE